MNRANNYEPGDMVLRTHADEVNMWPPGTFGLLIEPVPSHAPIWKVLVNGNIAEWTAYNFKRAFPDEQRKSVS